MICTLINFFFFFRLQPVLQLRECYWFGIDFGVICCHSTKNSFAKLFDIRTAGNVTFVNVFNHIFNKTADAHHKSYFPLQSKCVKSANLLLQLKLSLLNKGVDLKTDSALGMPCRYIYLVKIKTTFTPMEFLFEKNMFSDTYGCCKGVPDLLPLNFKGSVSVLKYSAATERTYYV